MFGLVEADFNLDRWTHDELLKQIFRQPEYLYVTGHLLKKKRKSYQDDAGRKGRGYLQERTNQTESSGREKE